MNQWQRRHLVACVHFKDGILVDVIEDLVLINIIQIISFLSKNELDVVENKICQFSVFVAVTEGLLLVGGLIPGSTIHS